MSEDVKPRIWKAISIEWRKDSLVRNVTTFKEEGLKVIELEPTIQLMKEMGRAMKGAQHMFKAIQYDVKQERGVGCDDKCSSYGHSNACFLANDLHEDDEVIDVNKALEKYRKFLEWIEK